MVPRNLALGLLTAALVLPVAAFAEKPSWGPWHSGSGSSETATDPRFVGKLFRFYQKTFSSEDGASCPFYPTCSGFSYGAMKRHGFIYGGILTVDRLLSEYPGLHKSHLYPLITKHGTHRLYDPVP